MAPDRVDHLLLVAGALDVEVHADVVRRQERERLVQRQRALGHLAVRVCEPQVGADVELDEVRAGSDGRLQRRERVLGRDRGRAAMADDDRRAVATPEIHVFLITTIAQSSPRSPPA